MNINKIVLWGVTVLLVSCSANEDAERQQQGIISFSTSIESFEGEAITRTNLKGNEFENGDKIKLKIVCPFSSHTEFGETTYGNSFDAFWLL